MFKEGKINNEEEPLKIIREIAVEKNEPDAEISREEKIEIALEKQDAQLNFRERNCDRNTLSGFKKWLGVATVLGASLLAVGCKAEKPSSGFTDNVHQNVQQRLKNKQNEVKRMHENSRIVNENGSYEKSTQRHSENVEQSPTGRVSNPEDL
jgi:hypothetical protein